MPGPDGKTTSPLQQCPLDAPEVRRSGDSDTSCYLRSPTGHTRANGRGLLGPNPINTPGTRSPPGTRHPHFKFRNFKITWNPALHPRDVNTHSAVSKSTPMFRSTREQHDTRANHPRPCTGHFSSPLLVSSTLPLTSFTTPFPHPLISTLLPSGKSTTHSHFASLSGPPRTGPCTG